MGLRTADCGFPIRAMAACGRVRADEGVRAPTQALPSAASTSQAGSDQLPTSNYQLLRRRLAAGATLSAGELCSFAAVFALRADCAAGHLVGSMGKTSTQATWGGRFAGGPADLMLRFSESVSFDRRLAAFDIAGSKAHSAMLAHVGLITAKERDAIHAGLDAIWQEIEAGRFTWETKLEDVHMNIEQALTRRVPEAAKLHTARSRNDQVATDMRLWFKHACGVLSEKIAAAQRALLAVAQANRDVLIPGYTHLQRAQPVFVAHHLFAWMEMLQRDRIRLAEVASHANWCPLGSGAIAGTTLPISLSLTQNQSAVTGNIMLGSVAGTFQGTVSGSTLTGSATFSDVSNAGVTVSTSISDWNTTFSGNSLSGGFSIVLKLSGTSGSATLGVTITQLSR